MRRFAVCAFALLYLLVWAFPANSLGAEKPWFGGIYTSFRGFSEQTGLPAAEYMAVGLFAEPLAIHILNPALGIGLLLPLSPSTDGGLRLQLALDLTLADIPVSFLKNRFYLSSFWSPGLEAECLIPFDFDTARFALVGSPLRARSGDAVFTVASVALLLDQEARLKGWGITLFKASLFLF
jgi:hypothetical protein